MGHFLIARHCIPVSCMGFIQYFQILKFGNNVIWRITVIHCAYVFVTISITWLKCNSKVTSHFCHKLTKMNIQVQWTPINLICLVQEEIIIISGL